MLSCFETPETPGYKPPELVKGVHASVGTGGLVSLLTGEACTKTLSLRMSSSSVLSEVLAPVGDLEERTKAVALLTAMVGSQPGRFALFSCAIPDSGTG